MGCMEHTCKVCGAIVSIDNSLSSGPCTRCGSDEIHTTFDEEPDRDTWDERYGEWGEDEDGSE
jgi:predicted  nucleic acid-binding Zn-ribbon protein